MTWQPPDNPAARPIGEQIAELKRELALRKNVYPSQVARPRMDAAEATDHYERMQAALKTLMWVEKNAEAIKKAVADESSSI